jgi:ABC-2 type transport system ATP-binding protein
MEAAFRESAEQERSRGRTVLLSSHILSEVEALCDRVTIIRAGRTVETGTLAEMRHLTRTSIAAELAGPVPGLANLAGVHDLVVDASQDGGSRVRCEVDSDLLGDLLKLLVAAGVRTLTSQPPTLEELFLRHYTDPQDTSRDAVGQQDPQQLEVGQDADGHRPAGQDTGEDRAAGQGTVEQHAAGTQP